ncbi:MAG: sulfotransferase family protein [Dolichospermum sp.]
MQNLDIKLHFLGLGSERCASTFLHLVLKDHPQLCLPKRKEMNFWSGSITEQKLVEYLKNFEYNKNCLVGEISPTYAAMYSEEVGLVKQLIPNLKVILIIRNPLDRLVSSITRSWTYFHVDKKVSNDRNFFSLLRYVDLGLSRRLTDYLRTYQIWSKHFGKDNIFLEKFENISSYPQDVLTRILDFLEVNSNIIDESVFLKKPNKSKEELKSEIPEFLKWYIAVEWLPKVKKMAILLPLDLHNWIQDLEAIVYKDKYNLKFWLIYVFHKIYFYIPYYSIYPLYKYFQIKMKIAKTRRDLAL